MNKLSVASLGIGFGALAIATIGFITPAEEQIKGGGYEQVSWFLQYEAKRAEYLRSNPVELVSRETQQAETAKELVPQPAKIAVTYKPIQTTPPISKEEIASIMKEARLEAERMEEELIVALLMEFMS